MDATSSSIWTFLAAPRFVFSVFPFLQQARKSSGEQAASSPHVTLTLCTDCSTLFRGFKLHGHSCLHFPQDRYYRLLASFHWGVTSTNSQSSLDDETHHFCSTRWTVIMPESKAWNFKNCYQDINKGKLFLRENLQRTFWKVNWFPHGLSKSKHASNVSVRKKIQHRL